MAQNIGRRIVTDGLVYHLDPTNGQKGESATILKPTQLSGCELWLDASDLDTISTSSSVSNWFDKSGNGAHAAQSTSANRPTLVKYGWNGLSYLQFDGSNDTMTGTLANTIVDDSMFLVIRTRNSASDAGVFYVGSFTSKGMTHHNAGTFYCYFSSGGISLRQSMSLEIPHIISRSYADAVATARIDGCGHTHSSGTPADPGGNDVYAIANATNECEIDIGEIIVYNRKLTDVELKKVERYLSLKWGIPLGGRRMRNLADGVETEFEDASSGAVCVTHRNTLEFRLPAADDCDLRLEGNEISIADNLPWTQEFWIKRNKRGAITSTYDGVWGNQLASSEHERLQFSTSLTVDRLILVDSGNNNSATELGNWDIDCLHKWRHVAITFDGRTSSDETGAVQCYVDGRHVANTNLNSVDSKITIRRIGSRGSTSDEHRLEGEIGCLRIYDRELHHSEILSNYNATKSRFQNKKMQLPQVDNMILYLDADSGSSSTNFSNGNWLDLTGDNVYSGEREGDPQFTTTSPNSLKGQYYDFDGTGDYFDCGTALGTALGDNYTGGFSVSLWFKADAADKGLFNMSSFSSDYGALSLYISGSELIFRIASDVSTKVSFSNTDNWYNVVGTYDGSTTKKIYLDGKLEDSDAYTADLDLDGLKTIVGGFYSTSYVFNGRIAVVQVYKTALSSDEVSQNFNYFRGRYGK